MSGKLIAAAAVCAFALAGCASTPTATTSSSTAGKTSAVAAEKAQESADTAGVEDYTIVGEAKRSTDQAPDYFVTIDPVNLGNEAFKLDVKKVLRALAAKTGGPAFSAQVFDNTEIAQQTYAALSSDPKADPAAANGEAKAQHLIAAYKGGVADSPSQITWFPSADDNTPKVGQWTEPEDWKP